MLLLPQSEKKKKMDHDHDHHGHDHHGHGHHHHGHGHGHQHQHNFGRAQQEEVPMQPEEDLQAGGSARLHPDGRQFINKGNPNAALDNPTHQDINAWIRRNLHICLILAVIAFFAARKLRILYLDWQSQQQVKSINSADNRTPDDKINDGIRLARERQMQAAKEAAKRDAELKEQRRLEDIAERERRLKEAQLQAEQEGNRTVGSSSDAGFSERLPTLPSGNNYIPSSNWSNDDSRSHYRPTGFSRPRRG